DLDTFLWKIGAAVYFEGAVKASLATQFVNIVEIGEVLESVLQVLRTPANKRVIHWLSVAVLRFGQKRMAFRLLSKIEQVFTADPLIIEHPYTIATAALAKLKFLTNLNSTLVNLCNDHRRRNNAFDVKIFTCFTCAHDSPTFLNRNQLRCHDDIGIVIRFENRARHRTSTSKRCLSKKQQEKNR